MSYSLEHSCKFFSTFTLFTMDIILLFVLSMSTLTQCMNTTPCHPKCTCAWWKGKQTSNCSSAGFETIPDGLDPSIQVLDLNRNDITVLPRNAFLKVGLINLQKLYMNGCGIKHIDDSALKLLSNLVELDLSDNSLSYVPTAAFRNVPSLRVLVLSGNPLVVVQTRAFANLKSLKILALSNCKIRTVASRAFEGVEELGVLNLDRNELSSVRGVEKLANLREMSLFENPWNCDCQLWRLQQWFRARYVIHAPGTCYRPSRLRGKKWDELKNEDYGCPSTLQNITTGTEDVLIAEGEGIISRVIAKILEILSAVL